MVNNGGPNGGNPRFVDLFTLSTALVAAGLLAGVVSLVTSILTTRAPGMNMRRVPFFTWSVLVSSVALAIALPVLIGILLYVFVAHRYPSLSELSGNRALADWAGFGFTQPTTILFVIPVFGFFADAAATATKARLRTRGMVFAGVALVGAAVFGTVVQSPVMLPFAMVHGLPLLGAFMALSLTVKGLRAKPSITAPFVFGLFAAVLALGGIAANALAHVGDAGLAGTTFEEGNWLAIVFSGVLAAMGGVAYWGPKWWGRSLPTAPALLLALVTFAGAALASLSMMIAGFADQPGGVFPSVERGADAVVNFDYSGPMALWNLLNTAGHGLVLLAVVSFLALSLRLFVTGSPAGDDPWDGQTLEWATTSPAPTDNFATVHIVRSAEPLLDLKPTNRSDA